jgi:molybdopterin-synthase adenylyltransferase
MTTIPDRDLRQRDIIPPDRLATCKATVIGVGAIGRQIAQQLASIGVPTLQLVDFDTVEPVNLACQGYFEDDLGRPKVQATADLVQQLNHQLEVQTLNERFRRSTQIGNVLFCCVDKIETRQLIWDAVRDRVAFFADGRMSAETIRVLVAADPASRKHYPTTLFAAGEAHVGACTARSTIFCANIAAGLMLEQFARFLRHMPVDSDLQLNLLSSELTVTS